MKLPIIAVDGYSATGKSSVSKKIAEILNIIHIDSGAMYRAVTYFAIENYFDKENNQIDIKTLESNLDSINIEFKYDSLIKKNSIFLNNHKLEYEIRTLNVNKNVSIIAKNSKIRDFLTLKQKKLGEKGGIIIDGRDIGSNVFPNADFKFFVTASIEERTKRRFLELKNQEISMTEVKNNLIERDFNDSNRKIAPLIQTEDAILIDNTNLNESQTVELILSYIKKYIKIL